MDNGTGKATDSVELTDEEKKKYFQEWDIRTPIFHFNEITNLITARTEALRKENEELSRLLKVGVEQHDMWKKSFEDRLRMYDELKTKLDKVKELCGYAVADGFYEKPISLALKIKSAIGE